MTEYEESELDFIMAELRDSIILSSRSGDYNISALIDKVRWQLQELMQEVRLRKSGNNINLN